MMHRAWCNVKEASYNFSRSSIKFQGHTSWKIDNLNQIWVRLLSRSQLSNPSDLPCFQLNYSCIKMACGNMCSDMYALKIFLQMLVTICSESIHFSWLFQMFGRYRRSLADPCQIWMWFKKSDRNTHKFDNFSNGEINAWAFNNPHPSTCT